MRGRVARLPGMSSGPDEQPPCQRACPLDQDVPAYVNALSRGAADEALEVICRDNPLPAVCGWICSHPCTRACVRGKLDEGVAIRDLKLAACANGTRPSTRTVPGGNRCRIDVIGAGPAGLSTAFFLALAGHEVVVHEAEAEPGGLLHSCVPAFDLPHGWLEKDVDFIRGMGVIIETGSRIDSAAGLEKLFEHGASAIVIATGAGRGAGLDLEKGEPEGCLDAVSFARQHAHGRGPQLSGPAIVYGAGHMAAAVARMALRSGASPVTLLSGAKKRNKAAEPDGVALAEEEGVEILTAIRPIRALGDESLDTLRCETPEGEKDLPAKLLIAAEQRVPDLGWLAGELELGPRGTLRGESKTFMTSRRGVFAAGEVLTGPRDVIRALSSGKRVARAVDGFLCGEDRS